jgi:hypothetical protein
VPLCWLALLVIRIPENAAGDTWHNLVDAGKYGGGARSDDWRSPSQVDWWRRTSVEPAMRQVLCYASPLRNGRSYIMSPGTSADDRRSGYLLTENQ